MTRSSHSLRCRTLGALVIGGLLATGNLNALTLPELEQDPKMNPKRFANLFGDFKFEMHPFDVQNPNDFLATESGTCIDYAVLADHVLKPRGFDTRLIRVELVGREIGHAVCYVTEKGAYLDYNKRAYFFNLERSGRTIREIATSVADSFGANWTLAAEFTLNYVDYERRIVVTVVKTDPPETDLDLVRPRKASTRPKL